MASNPGSFPPVPGKSSVALLVLRRDGSAVVGDGALVMQAVRDTRKATSSELVLEATILVEASMLEATGAAASKEKEGGDAEEVLAVEAIVVGDEGAMVVRDEGVTVEGIADSCAVMVTRLTVVVPTGMETGIKKVSVSFSMPNSGLVEAKDRRRMSRELVVSNLLRSLEDSTPLANTTLEMMALGKLAQIRQY